VALATSSKIPFPDRSFKDFSKFVNSNFGSQVSMSTVLLVLFTMTENSALLNLNARQKNPQHIGELKQTSSGWIRALAWSLIDRLEGKANSLFIYRE
jgi:hypothetical protein